MAIWRKAFLFLLFILFLGACQQAAPVVEDEVSEVESVGEETAVSPTQPPAEPDPTVPPTEETNTPESEGVVTQPPPTVDRSPISDEEAKSLMFNLSNGTYSEAEVAMIRVLNAEDQRFVGVFLELFRARQIGLTRTLGVDELGPALEQLSGQTHGNNWNAWVEWYGTTDLTVPDGFVSWKGQMLTLIDPDFGVFLQDRHPTTIRPEEILWGGVVVDGIPPLDNPPMIMAEEAVYLDPWDPVFGLSINGDSRAYPLRIIDWHEMANDVIGGVPVSIAYCTLCGAAIAYDGRGSDGTEYTFSSSGFLFRSNKLMYDRQTLTLWNQLTGEPVMGELVESDVELEILPIVLTTWEEWQAQHPDTVVVDEETGFERTYELGAAYGDYFQAPITMFPVWQRDGARETKDFVFALNIDDTPKAYPVDLLAEAGVVNDVLAETAVTLIANRGVVESDAFSLRAGPVNYSSGAEVRAYERGNHIFSPTEDPDIVLDEDGNEWQVTEEALLGPDGEMAPRISGHLAYWFGWFAFYPETLLYEG